MTGQPPSAAATHASFTIERVLKAPPARVFNAWSTLEAKKKWFFGGDGWIDVKRTLDFREGGREALIGRKGSGVTSAFLAHYWEIVPNQRIVYAYEMNHDGARLSVSLASVEFRRAGNGTHLTLTEHGVYLVAYDPDGDDNGSRRRGTLELIDRVAKLVEA